jgi:methionine biosynthesis protein MetW
MVPRRSAACAEMATLGPKRAAALSQAAAINSGLRNGLRQDLRLIAELIEPHSRVLDVGCADGALLAHLARTKQVDARGIELSQTGVHECVSQGLAVVQGDGDTDLAIYPDGSFDYVILTQTIQAMRHPRQVLENMLRIGRYGIVSFTNYAHWRARWYLMRHGRMPMARCLPDPWYSTANIHPCTLEDFERLCAELGLRIEQRSCLAADGRPSRLASSRWLDNLFSEQALFVLSRPEPADARPPRGPFLRSVRPPRAAAAPGHRRAPGRA